MGDFTVFLKVCWLGRCTTPPLNPPLDEPRTRVSNFKSKEGVVKSRRGRGLKLGDVRKNCQIEDHLLKKRLIIDDNLNIIRSITTTRNNRNSQKRSLCYDVDFLYG